MADQRLPEESASPTDIGMAQTSPVLASMFHEADSRHMLNELAGTVGALSENVRSIDSRLDRDSRKLDEIETRMDGLKDLSAKLDDVLGFIKHGVPHLASKADIETLNKEISHRPTRRQSITDFVTVVGLIAALMAITLHFAK